MKPEKQIHHCPACLRLSSLSPSELKLCLWCGKEVGEVGAQMPFDMEVGNLKIRVSNPEESERAQSALFRLKTYWHGSYIIGREIKLTDKPFLYANPANNTFWCGESESDFLGYSFKEVLLDELEALAAEKMSNALDELIGAFKDETNEVWEVGNMELAEKRYEAAVHYLSSSFDPIAKKWANENILTALKIAAGM